MISLTIAINRFFGRKPNQTLQEFSAEIRAIPEESKRELAGLLSEELKEEVEI